MLVCLAAFLVSGCATIPEMYDESVDAGAKYPDFSLGISHDFFNTRITLYNTKITNTQTKTSYDNSTGQTTTTTSTRSSDTPESVLVVSLGHGLYVDTSGNIFVQPLALLGADIYGPIKIHAEKKVPIGTVTNIIESNGSSYTQEYRNEAIKGLGIRSSGTISREAITKLNNDGSFKLDILGEGMHYESPFLLKLLKSAPQGIYMKEGCVYLEGFGGFNTRSPFAEQLSEDEIKIQRLYTVTRIGNSLHFEIYATFFQKMFSIFQDRYVDIIFQDNRILAFVNGKLKTEVVVGMNQISVEHGPDHGWVYRVEQ